MKAARVSGRSVYGFRTELHFADGRLLRKGRGRETVKGKVLLNKLQEEIISLVPWLGSCRRKCIWQTRTWRAN